MSRSDKNSLIMRYPSSWWYNMWREALPSGNGHIGAAVYGGVGEETILLNHEKLWWNGKTIELPDVSSQLPEMRRLLLENKALEASDLMSKALIDANYNGTLPSPLPLADFKIYQKASTAFKNYRRKLNMENGEVSVKWTDDKVKFERVCFVSRNDDMIVYEIRGNEASSITARFNIVMHDKTDARRPFDWQNAPLPTGIEERSEGNYIYYAGHNEGEDYGAVARIITTGGAVTKANNGILVSESDNILVYIKLFYKGERIAQWAALKKELSSINKTYKELLKPHAQKHRKLFKRMTLDLKASEKDYSLSNEELRLDAYEGEAKLALIEKMWAFGRYMLISASSEGGEPCAMYGLWGGDYDAFWGCHMANENIQMIYWQACSGNIPEMSLALFEYLERYIEDYRTNAKNLFGCRGIYIPAPFAPGSGLIKTTQPHIIHMIGAAGWLCQHYFDYYLYTLDDKFLRERAMPFLYETGLFYEDYLIKDSNGKYMIIPSNSPENTPGNYYKGDGMGSDMEVTINATIDVAICKEVLTNLIAGSAITGQYTDHVAKWQDIINNLPAYEINDDGAIKEWLHQYFTDNYHHRHQSHIYPVFPGTEVTRQSDTELFDAFFTAVRKRLIIGLKEQSGWGLSHMANNYARMGNGDLAIECLDILARCGLMNNFYTTHNDWRNMGICVDLQWAPFQTDANMGWTSSIHEMLLFSRIGEICPFPALPKRFKQGSVKGMLARGGVVVDLTWNQKKGKASIKLNAKRDQDVSIIVPQGMEIKGEQVYELKKGKPVIVELIFN